MKVLNCAATCRRLDAFHDQELSIADQIAVSAHLDWCDDCARIAAEMRLVGSTLRAAAPGRRTLATDDAAGFHALVLSRVNAERSASIGAQLRAMFDDLRLVYVGVGATVATAVCLILMMGMMRFATDSRPDSLAAILDVMAAPLECDSVSLMTDALACRERWAERFQRARETAQQETVFTLDAVVTYDGRLANLRLLRASRQRDSTDHADVIEELLDSVSRASATQASELSAGIVRVIARETVRAPRQLPNDLTLPPAKPAAAVETAGLATA